MLFDLLDTAGIDCRKAISSEMADFEDAVMVETALRCGMDCIITRNVKDFQYGTIKAILPDDFISLMENDSSGRTSL